MSWPETPDAAFHSVSLPLAGGNWGEGSYGDEAYGGQLGGSPFAIPVPQSEIPGDDLTSQLGTGHGRAGVTTHRRAGVLIGERSYAAFPIWSVFWTYALDAAFIAQIRVAFEQRFFRLVHNPNDFNIYTPVHWVEDEFQARQRRGSNWELSFTLEAYAGDEIVP